MVFDVFCSRFLAKRCRHTYRRFGTHASWLLATIMSNASTRSCNLAAFAARTSLPPFGTTRSKYPKSGSLKPDVALFPPFVQLRHTHPLSGPSHLPAAQTPTSRLTTASTGAIDISHLSSYPTSTPLPSLCLGHRREHWRRPQGPRARNDALGVFPLLEWLNHNSSCEWRKSSTLHG